MSSKEKHLIQYARNKSLANSEPLIKEENNDWRITVIFYAIMHLLDSCYSDVLVKHTTHEIRKKFISSTSPYNDIIDVYTNLEMLSRKARYDCVKMKKTHVEDAIHNMSIIESFVKKIHTT